MTKEILTKKDVLSCNNGCIHKTVCKEVENWTKYHNEHLELRKESILFDSSPVCPYYLSDKEKLKEDVNKVYQDNNIGMINNTTGLDEDILRKLVNLFNVEC